MKKLKRALIAKKDCFLIIFSPKFMFETELNPLIFLFSDNFGCEGILYGFFTRLVEFVPIKRSLSRITENFSINFYGDDSVPGDLSQLSGFPD